MKTVSCITLFFCVSLALQTGVWAQPQLQPPGGTAPAQAAPGAPAQTVNFQGPMELLRPTYELRPGDQIVIRAFEMEDISDRPFLIDGDGYINLPALGRLKVGGLTTAKLEAVLVDLLKRYVRVPQVTVTIVAFSSQPVFFLGAFKSPGIYPLQGRRTLVEMISSIGGFLPNASRRVKVTRRKEFGKIPLDNAVDLPDRNVSTVEINMSGLRENISPAEDIVLMAFDAISVEKAEMIYINGEVGKVGAVELQDKDSISIIQALTLAGGLTPSANPKTVWILRPVLETSRRAEIPVDLEKILAGKESDRPLLANDVLYVPKQSGIKRNLGRTLLIALPTVVSAVGIGIAVTR